MCLKGRGLFVRSLLGARGLRATGVVAGPVSEAARRTVPPSPGLGATPHHAYSFLSHSFCRRERSSS